MSRRKTEHKANEADERWVISYADLVTLLFGFFLLLYATADANATKFQALARGLSEAFHVPVKESAAGGSIFPDGSGIVPGRNDAHATIDSDLQFIRAVVQQASLSAGLSGQIVVSKENDHIVIRDMMYVSCSFDHRIIDGHVGAAFVQSVRNYLAHPAMLFVGLE